jgi:hypothetical protein
MPKYKGSSSLSGARSFESSNNDGPPQSATVGDRQRAGGAPLGVAEAVNGDSGPEGTFRRTALTSFTC